MFAFIRNRDYHYLMTTKEAAEKWGISERRINVLCAQKRIEGAIKEDGRWSIPDSAHKPEDRRIKSRQEEIVFPETGKKPLPIGISDYRKASVGYYYGFLKLFCVVREVKFVLWQKKNSL